MKLRTPITGTTIVVADDKAKGYIDMGFAVVEPAKAAQKKAAKKSKSKEQ